MAAAPLLQLSGISLGPSQAPLFHGLDLVVQPGDRMALVGRNGAGKSTLLALLDGAVEADQGTRSVPARTRVVRLEQEPDFSAFATLEGFVGAALGVADLWRGTALAEEVGLDLAT
ncbi:MAG: ATP-binding cassette domain-containing protein, partial [Pseudomonadota bacterium]